MESLFGRPNRQRGEIDISAKKSRPKSKYRDAAFMRAFTDLATAGSLGARFHDIVISNESKYSSRPSKGPKRYPQWYLDESIKFLPLKPKHRKGAEWGYTTDFLRLQFAHYALCELGPVQSLSLHLSHEIRDEAIGRGDGAKRFLTQRLSYRLRRALNKTVQFWFVLETSERLSNDLHLHGEISCDAAESKAVRAALRAAVGEFIPTARRHQAHTAPVPDEGQVGYATKDQTFAVRGRRALKSMGRTLASSWADDPLMITSELRSAARTLYDEARQQVTIEW